MRTMTARLVALGLTLAACSVAAEATTTTTTEASTTSTSTSTTSTSTTMPEETSPVTGLPVADPALLERRLLAVKIDNHPRAIPQSGIDQADMVVEMLVEGITRYLTLWMESDSTYLGPMRSARPTDTNLLLAIHEPTYARSGSQEWVQAVAVAAGIHLVGEVGPPATFRIPDRRAPHNLYVDTVEIRKVADARGHPDEPPVGPLWEFGPMPADADPASRVTMGFGGNTTTWDWNRATGTWLRTAYGEESSYRNEDGTEGRVGVPVMVAIYVDQYLATPPPGFGGSALPSSQILGSGPAYVFADGKVVEGVWERASEEEWFSLSTADGETIPVPPGRVWVSLVTSDRGLTYEP